MVCGYARVSTKIQEKNGNSLDSQEDLLRDSGARLVYKESCSGGTLDRPQLNELLHALEPGDTLMSPNWIALPVPPPKALHLSTNYLVTG